MIKTRGWKLGLGLVILAGAVLVSGVAFADHESGQVAEEEWVARYNGPGNWAEYAESIVVDSQGNVYMTGWSAGNGTAYDYATVKYDPNGSELWVARYNGPGNYYDVATSIAVDQEGNVYITGGSYGSGTRYDYVTIKYDQNGNQLWLARYNGPGNDADKALSLVLDSQGNVYVTGYSDGGATSEDYVTIKYDPNGNRLWEARYNGPGNLYDFADSLAIDSQDNIYVTGESQGDKTGYDYATIKYDLNGNRLWVARYNGPGNFNDHARSIDLDSQGNICVTGYSYGSGTDADYATIKYDTNGNELWVTRYNGPGNDTDEAHSLSLDPEDNIYVTGFSKGSGIGHDYVTIKYDTDGNESWVTRYDGGMDDRASSIGVDSQGNVYVTGESYGATNDYVTIKYGIDGNESWVARYNGPGNGEDQARSLVVDPQGNVYITGRSEGEGTSYDYATIKYNQLPTVSIDLQEYDNVLHRGEELKYRVTLTNNTDQEQLFNYWSEVKDQDGVIREAVTPMLVGLAPNGMSVMEFSHPIPGRSPNGLYEYIGNVGEDIDHLWEEDTFTFNIVPPGIFDINLKEGAR